MIRGLAALWLTAATLAAAGDGVLAGLIQDRTGAAMVSASVTAMDQETGIRRSTHADGTGAYEIAALPPGQYKLTVRKPGFQTIVRWNVAIGSGQDARLDFAMQVGSMHEVITIE
ncbi:MAG TPA: carboxypeptidase-like regulatory domain-containing protein, partial [Bryobacteraceae bacterium]|nr:carboxypeptidase-like regulatory domain-containing protein [Bryobacteraceae bacterium]